MPYDRKMKEVIVSPTLPEVSAAIHDVPIPAPKENELLVKVVVACSNAKG
jgi:hypothetical protein